MRKLSVFVLASSVLVSTPALANGFTGPRVEVRGGWDKTTLDLSYDDGVDSFSGDGSEDGFNIGAEVGYDAALGTAIVAGAYAGVEFATTKECTEVFGADEACLKLGRNFTLGARLGAKIAPQALLYAKGGYTNGQIKATYDNDLDPTLDASDETDRGGFHLGFGGEMSVGRNGYVRLEYVRTNYNDYDYSDSTVDVKVDGHRDQVLFGTGLRF